MNKMLSLALCATAFVATTAHAQSYTAYTDKDAFNAAAGATQTETFSAATQGNFANDASGTYTGTFSAFSVTGNNNGNNVGVFSQSVADGGDNFPIPDSFLGQNFLSWSDNGPGDFVTLTFNLTSPTTAFGFDWFNTDYSDQYGISPDGGTTVFTGPPFNVAPEGTTSGFFGITSSTPFSTVTVPVQGYGGYISTEGLDNVVTSSIAAAAPEPGTWAMMIIGFGVVGAAFRSAKRRSDDSFEAKIKRITNGALA